MLHLSKMLMQSLPLFSHPDVMFDDGIKKIVRATSEHAAYLQHHLREEDVIECKMHGATPWWALHSPLAKPDAETWTGIYKDVPMCMFGTSPISRYDDFTIGTVWMLGTEAVSTEYRTFLRLSRIVADYLCTRYDIVENVVPIEHHKTIMWLAWLGFTFNEIPIEIGGVECVRFVRCAADVEVSFN